MTENFREEQVEDAEPVIVHWMEPKHLSLGAGAATAATAGAFALGVVATLAALALARWLETEERHVWFKRR